MYLTQSIDEYWALGDPAPFPCVMQLVQIEPFTIQRNGILNWRIHLSDGKCILSQFVYRPAGIDSQKLPDKYSVIKVWSAKFKRHQDWSRLGFYHVFDDFEIVAENTGRITNIGNPWYHKNDDYAVKNFD